ncbi:hypothetical protein [Glycomyces artemisiae]|uniref:N4-gp56 family major capsid protein n=1 Tax=Glycomyces artemisiae TaxID=1076443 RepID=A0A2T0UES4_9ACTN|nr:hypothetical protein [Glycomyces artemisiae]PRY56445.1 N4-gp56 family major capsid protein [Glycomyces artemisiae]
MTTLTKRGWFNLARHDVRSTLPSSIRAIMQNGLLDRAFEDALTPQFLYPRVAASEPWQGGLGDTSTATRTGLLEPKTTPITGSDPSPSSYAVEQWSVTMDQYGDAIDTNMLQSSMTLASKFLKDIQTLATGAGQSLNRIARDRLYRAYSGGRTWVTAAATTDTSMVVESVDGFTHVVVNGVPTPVSGSNPLNITVDGVANTVIGVNTGTNTLTLGTTRVDVIGEAVVSANAPVSIRPGAADTAFDLTGSNVATLSLFRAATTRLRRMNVDTIDGAYVAHIDAETLNQLFDDEEFQRLYQGRGEASAVWRDLAVGRVAGIDFVRNEEAPIAEVGSVDVHQPIVYGADALVAAPFAEMGRLLAETDVSDVPSIQMVDAAPNVQVARIIRPPQDRLQQIVSSAWSWVGDFGVPSDITTGDAALFKRAVVIEHAG